MRPLLLLLFSGLLAQTAPPLPEGNAYVRALVHKQRHREAVLDSYTYDVLSVREELDKDGAVKSRRSQRFETFYVKGRPLRRLVEEDGKALSPERQAREDRRVQGMAEAIRRGAVATERPLVRLSLILERFDFRAVDREDVAGRTAVVLEFAPLPGARPVEGDRVLRHLTGRLWVDEAEQEVVRAEVHNTAAFKVGLGVGASVSRVESRLEFRKVDDAAWLPWRDETLAVGRMFLVKSFRTRVTRSYSGFRRFQVEAQEKVGPD